MVGDEAVGARLGWAAAQAGEFPFASPRVVRVRALSLAQG